MKNVLSLSQKTKWNQFIDKLPLECRDVYFTSDYYSLYQNYGMGEAMLFVFEKESEIALYPFLKNNISSLGYDLDREYYDIQGAYGYNGLIASTNDSAFVDAFWNEFDTWCIDNNIVAEFTRFHPLLNNKALASPKMKILFSRNTVALNLIDDDIWMHQISSKNRNMIRKAEKEGVTIIESHDYETFKKLYDETMTNLHAEEFYFFPQAYYNEFQESFKDNGMLCFALLDEKVVAGSLFFFYGEYAHYHLSARDRNYSRFAANNLLLWYGIQKAKKRGCKWLHLGGGTTGNEDDSLLKFKKEFSKNLFEFWIGKRVHNQKIYNQVVEQWKNRYPNSFDRNRIKLLGYRDIL